MNSKAMSGYGMVFTAVTILAGCGGQTEQRSVDLTVPVTVQAVRLDTMEATVAATGTPPALQRSPYSDRGRGGIIQYVARGVGGRPTEGNAGEPGTRKSPGL